MELKQRCNDFLIGGDGPLDEKLASPSYREVCTKTGLIAAKTMMPKQTKRRLLMLSSP
jgi:hypothetical protein